MNVQAKNKDSLDNFLQESVIEFKFNSFYKVGKSIADGKQQIEKHEGESEWVSFKFNAVNYVIVLNCLSSPLMDVCFGHVCVCKIIFDLLMRPLYAPYN